MKPKSKNIPIATKVLIKTKNSENENWRAAWRKIGLRLAAVLLIIVFLAGECAALIPLE
jgi:hypothetical protein